MNCQELIEIQSFWCTSRKERKSTESSNKVISKVPLLSRTQENTYRIGEYWSDQSSSNCDILQEMEALSSEYVQPFIIALYNQIRTHPNFTQIRTSQSKQDLISAKFLL